MSSSDATPSQQLDAALAQFSKNMARVGHAFAGQGAMGWMLRGDMAKAREALQRVPSERLPEISIAAAALSALADELAADGDGV